MLSEIAPGLQALQSPTALQALEMMRSMVAPGLQALKSLIVSQTLGRAHSDLAVPLKALSLMVAILFMIAETVVMPLLRLQPTHLYQVVKKQ